MKKVLGLFLFASIFAFASCGPKAVEEEQVEEKEVVIEKPVEKPVEQPVEKVEEKVEEPSRTRRGEEDKTDTRTRRTEAEKAKETDEEGNVTRQRRTN